MQTEGKKKNKTREGLMFSREVITPCGRGDGDCRPPCCSETFSLGQYIVFSVLILMQSGGCTWKAQGSRQAEGGHYFPVPGPVQLRGDGCARTYLRGAQQSTRGSSHKFWKGKFSSDRVKNSLHGERSEALGQVAQEMMWKPSLNTLGDIQTSAGCGPSLSMIVYLCSFPSHSQTHIIFSGFVISNSLFF